MIKFLLILLVFISIFLSHICIAKDSVCLQFHDELVQLPHANLSFNKNAFLSILDGKSLNGCEIVFESDESIISGDIVYQKFQSIVNEEDHARGIASWSTVSEEDGSFFIDCVHPRAFFALSVSPGTADGTTRIIDAQPNPGETIDLGEIVLVDTVDTSDVLDSDTYPYFEEFDLAAGNQQIRLSLTDPDSAISFLFFDGPVTVAEGDNLTIPSLAE